MSSTHQKNYIIPTVFTLFIALLPASNAFSQKFLPDTLFIDFNKDTMVNLSQIYIREINDLRNENPCFISYFTKKKLLLFPFDQEVYLRNPLKDELLNIHTGKPNEKNALRLDIGKFFIENHKGMLSKTSLLTADILLYTYITDTPVYKGTFYYRYIYRNDVKKEGIASSTTMVLSKWHTRFKLDLLSLGATIDGQHGHTLNNFVEGKAYKPIYMNACIATLLGINWWGIQGEIYFTPPETSPKNHYRAGLLKYQNNADYESLGLGRKANRYVYRLGNYWLFNIDYSFLLGYCKWKRIDFHKPTLYQIFNFELSSAQTISYNPLNNKSLIFKAGIMENFLYIIDKQLKMQAGMFVGFGIKL